MWLVAGTAYLRSIAAGLLCFFTITFFLKLILNTLVASREDHAEAPARPRRDRYTMLYCAKSPI
jgi:hypothetical protein